MAATPVIHAGHRRDGARRPLRGMEASLGPPCAQSRSSQGNVDAFTTAVPADPMIGLVHSTGRPAAMIDRCSPSSLAIPGPSRVV